LASRLEGKIMVQGAPVKFIPPTEPFTLLGVMITMTLDWGPQYLNALKVARHLAEKLSTSFASTAQKVRLLNSIFRPKLAYPFCIAPYTTKQVDELDKVLTTAFKVSYDQGKGYPSALARTPLLEGGLEATSLHSTYAKVCAQTLTRALRRTGSLGVITRATIHYG
jgi:hypothetical protein